MTISRRDFLEAGALSTVGFALGDMISPNSSVEAQAAQATGEQRWPRKPDARVVLSFDRDWRFIRPDSPGGDTAKLVLAVQGSDPFKPWDDAAWEPVNLPHTVRLEPFNASGGRNYQGVCWYQKHFAAEPEWQSRTIQLVFQGAMQVADVWLNGRHLTTHYGGYLPFTVDISKQVNFEGDRANVITVRLDNSDNPEAPPGKPPG